MRLYRDPDAPGRLDFDRGLYERIAKTDRKQLVHAHIVPIRSGYAWQVKAGSVVRLLTVEGPQVCDLNLWSMNNPRERFWAARTRQLQGAHVTTFDRLWSCLPYLRPMATIGSRCDPYLYKLLDDRDYDVTCHNNLTRAVAPYHLTELDVHDVLNVFQVTGLDPVHEIYFMEPSPAKPGDFFEFFAEIDLLCAISTCPSGDLSEWGWGADGADPVANCHPIGVEVCEVDGEVLEGWKPPEPVSIDSVYERGAR
ncbi:MAG: urea carboxylase-associated family protein [Chloroflexi bacterium]|nr:MAG: urea carboxylase-associated family protein [Chloroflexota bacterium]